MWVGNVVMAQKVQMKDNTVADYGIHVYIQSY